MSDFRIKTYVLGMMQTNCYLLYREGEKRAVIVDPADNASLLFSKCQELGLEPEAVLLTHGHSDHIMACEAIQQRGGIKVYACLEEEGLLSDPACNRSVLYGEPLSLKADVQVRDGEYLNFGTMKIQVLETPGHTAGSVCYYLEEEEVLISGDTLFAESLGRTDLPTGNTTQIIHSIKDKLFLLPQDTMVYPGHGEPTTIGHEMVYNPVARYKG